MQKKVLMAFDDPGGGLAVSSLIERLSLIRSIHLEIYSGRLSGKFLKKYSITYNNIDSVITREVAEGIIDNAKPDLLITGTGGGNAEQELRNIAFEKKIKSIVILDFWKDYARRWLYASYSLAEMKDKICVMDEPTKEEMTGEKFPNDNLIVTGHPYLDKIFNLSGSVSPENNFIENNMLFLSQPLNIIGLKDYKIHPLKILLESLKRLSEESNTNYTLNIRLHPSEEMSPEMENLNNLYNSKNLAVKFADNSISLEELLQESETVIGYNTIAMFESRALNRRTISLKVAPMRDSLIKAMESAGIEIIEADQLSIYESLAKRKDEFQKCEKDNSFKGGIENCVKLILSELNLN